MVGQCGPALIAVRAWSPLSTRAVVSNQTFFPERVFPMSQIIQFMNRCLLSRQQSSPDTVERRLTPSSQRATRRHRNRKQLLMEVMEDRVVLSAGQLASPSGVPHIAAELFRIKKATTLLAVGPASGVTGGTVTLTATLTANGSPLAGQSVRFQVKGRVVGKAKTDVHGVATLSNVKLKRIDAGAYSRGVVATFAGNSRYKLRTSRGALTVSHFATTLGGVAASGTYGGSVGFTATLMSNGVLFRVSQFVSHTTAMTWALPQPMARALRPSPARVWPV